MKSAQDSFLDLTIFTIVFILTNCRTESNEFQNCRRCGISPVDKKSEVISKKILNGTEMQNKNKYPWVVSLMLKNQLKCGGFLISSTAVLTAGHCVFNKQNANSTSECKGVKVPLSCFFPPAAVRVGLLSAKQQTPSQSESVAVKKIIPHPKYSSKLQVYDMAILQLAKPVKCDIFTSPVCLPARDDLKCGTSLIVAGYGWNTSEGRAGSVVLREGSVKVINPHRCVRRKQPRNIAGTIVCATGSESKQSACHGDSGSPLLGKFGTKFYAVGVVSRGKPKCNPKRETTFTKIQSALPFIKMHVKDLPRDTD